jgi:hypothetical protein
MNNPCFVVKNIKFVKKTPMRTKKLILSILIMAGAFIFTSCDTPVALTSWKNPQSTQQVSKVVVMPLFEKLEYMKPFELAMVNYFKSRGLKSMGSLEFLNPSIKYPIDDIKRKCDSLGVDAILVFTYTGTEKHESYIPPTTYYSGGYGGYGGYWGGGYWGGYYGGYYGGGGVTTTGGYWTSSSTVNVSSKLYVKGSPDPIWTAEIGVTDPEYVDEAADKIASYIYSDWQKQNLIKFPTKTK